jgi:hypothetical protein
MGTGGLRCGAGRPAYRIKAEQLQRVDIRVWRKRGLLWVGGSNSWLMRGDAEDSSRNCAQHFANFRFSEALHPSKYRCFALGDVA